MSPRVIAPNGDVYDLEDHVASGLVNGMGSEWEYAKPAKARASSRSRGKSAAETAAAARAAVQQPKATKPAQAEPVDEGTGSEPDGTPVGATNENPDGGDNTPAEGGSEENAESEADVEETEEEEDGDESAAEASEAPAKNAGTAAWADYAKGLGIDTEGLTRDQIREKVAAAASK